MITIETMYNDVIGGFSTEYPMIEYYKGNKKRYIYKRDYQKKIKAIAATLERELAGIEKGRFVGIKHETHPFWLAVFYALEMIGYRVMFLDEKATAKTLENCIQLGNLAAIVGMEKEEYPVRNIVFEQVIKEKEGCPKQICWADMLCLCTSGTTGIAKAIVFKADTIIRIQRVVRSTLIGHSCSISSFENLKIDQMKVLATLPMRHVFGFQTPSVYLGFGATLVFPKNQGVLELVRTIREDKIWMTYGVPALWKALFNIYKNQTDNICEETFHKFFGEQFTNGLIGGAKIDEDMKHFLKRVDFKMANTYGSTETGGCISYCYLTEEKSMKGNPGYTGKLFNSHRAGVINSSEEWNAEGKGELAIKGLNIYDGILKDGEFVSRKEAYGELLHTGDIFTIQGEDFYCMGRADHMIINDAGENIYVEELEEDFSFLKEKTNQYVAVGMNNKPILVLYGETINEEKLIEEILETNLKLPHYKRIENAYFVSSKLPVTSKNEVDRKRLEETLRIRKQKDESSVRLYHLRKTRKNGKMGV